MHNVSLYQNLEGSNFMTYNPLQMKKNKPHVAMMMSLILMSQETRSLLEIGLLVLLLWLEMRILMGMLTTISTTLIVTILTVMTKSLAGATNVNGMKVGHSSSRLTRSNQFWMNGRGKINMLWQKGMPTQPSILC